MTPLEKTIRLGFGGFGGYHRMMKVWSFQMLNRLWCDLTASTLIEIFVDDLEVSSTMALMSESVHT